MVAREADPRWVQGLLGHSSITTTERYLHTKARPDDVEFVLEGAEGGRCRTSLLTASAARKSSEGRQAPPKAAPKGRP